jgi:hypothetical protein
MSAPASTGITPRDRRVLVGVGAALFLFVYIVDCRPWDLENALMIGAPVGRDFVNFWLGGKLALEGRLDLLADFDGYNVLIHQLFHHNAGGLVFSYPPHILLFVAPFGALPFLPAVLLWSALNLALIAGAVRLLDPDRELTWAACLSPAALVMVAVGHFGGALAFLAVLILTRGSRQPVLAGCCLALISVKPQFAASFGLFLLLIGQWRTVLVAAPATAGLVGLSVLAFGIQPWLNFVQWTLPFHARILSDFQPAAFQTAIAIYTTARMIGLGHGAAWVLQLAYGLPLLAAAVLLFRRHGPEGRTIALGLLAVILLLPYSAVHDLAIAAPALTVALFAAPSGTDRPLFGLGAANALWLAPALAIPLGQLELPLVAIVVSVTVAVAASGQLWPPPDRSPSVLGTRSAAAGR